MENSSELHALCGWIGQMLICYYLINFQSDIINWIYGYLDIIKSIIIIFQTLEQDFHNIIPGGNHSPQTPFEPVRLER